MKQWGGRLVVLAALVAIGVLAWRYFFPNPERAIRKRLAEVAQTASFSANETPMAKFQNCQKLASFCTDDIEIAIDAYGQHLTSSGRDDLFKSLMFARSQLLISLNLDFLDPVITLAPDKQSAVVNLTIKGKVPNDRDMLVQECKFTLRKVGRSWLIQKVETVKTLSQRFSPGPERFSCFLWSAAAERSGDAALASSFRDGRTHQNVPASQTGRQCSLSPRERVGVRGNVTSNCIVPVGGSGPG